MSTGSQPFVLLALVVVAVVLVFPLGGQVEAKSYGIRSLNTTNCLLTKNLVQGSSPVGDDRSPLVVGSTAVYYAGDERIGRFDPQDLSLLSSSGRPVDGLFSDLGDGTFWTLATSATFRYIYNEANPYVDYAQSDITHLIPLAPDDAGKLVRDESRSVVALSQPLNPTLLQPADTSLVGQVNLFQGMGEFIFTSTFAAPSDKAGAFLVTIATGQVTRVYSPATEGQAWTAVPALEASECWARWGVMERHGDVLYVVGGVNNEYIEDLVKGGIFRYNLNGTLHSKIYEGDLDDAAAIAVTYFHASSGAAPRWYAHGQRPPSNPDFAGSSEWRGWLLSCDADLFYSASSATSVPCALCSLWATLFEKA